MPAPSFGIIKPCCIGDAVMALPVIDNLARAYPGTQTHVWCGRHSRAVFAGHPHIQQIADLPNVPTWRDLPNLIAALRKSNLDGFFVLDRSRLIAIACRVAGASVLGTVRDEPDSPSHETDRYLGTLLQAGVPVQTRIPNLAFPEALSDATHFIVDGLDSHYVTLHPGGAVNPGTSMPSKRWPAERWKTVVEWLSSRSIPSVLTGSPDERALCDEIAQGTDAHVAAGRLSLRESAEVAAHGIAFAGPDTGLTHLVAATGTPTIAIFGPTNPNQYGPRGENVTILAPSSSYQVGETDLRKSGASPGPSTNEIAFEQVTEALDRTINQVRTSR